MVSPQNGETRGGQPPPTPIPSDATANGFRETEPLAAGSDGGLGAKLPV